MTDDGWLRVKHLFQEVVERPLAERAALLAAKCAGDETLRRQVESLLACDVDDEKSFFDRLQLSENAASLPAGARIGAYEIVALIGAGAMGEVYRARDTKLNRDVALKVLPTLFAFDSGRLARFTREARLLAALNHPNIAMIYGLEDSAGVQALVLELIDGPTLAERVIGGSLTIDEVLSIASQIADALEAAHERSIIHRDLKPANIKIDRSGTVKVLDFGLAKDASLDAATPGLTASHHGLILGTASYMSPEQARGQSVDKRTDIWAFGCVVYEMLTGQLAFPGATVSDTIARILEHEPDWSALPASTPPRIRHLLVRCLTKDVKRRFRDIGDLKFEISESSELLPADPRFDAARQRGTLNRWLPWAAVAALIVTGVVRELVRPINIVFNPLADAQFSRFTDWDGTEGGAEISPDGRFVAFIADRAGEFDLWVSQVGTGEFRNLTSDHPSLGTPQAGNYLRSFGFSGDGGEIWFSVTADPVLSRKMIVPVSGGPARPFLNEGEGTPAWSSDGRRLVFFRNALNDALFIADRTAGDPRQIAIAPRDSREWKGPTERMHNHNVVWSPDDQWLYFVHGNFRARNWTDDMEVWRVQPAGGSPERLTHHTAAITFLAPLDTRTLLYVARTQTGAGPWLWALDVERKFTRRVSSGLEQYTTVAASHDGRRVVATLVDPVVKLWTVPIRDRPADDDDVKPFNVPTARALAPRFGGSSLFYLSARGTADGLWRFSDGHAVEIRKGDDGALFQPPVPSHDGSRVAVVHANDNRRRLAVMSADGTEFRGLAESLDVQGTADWSPDGTWIVAGGSDDTQGPGLFKIPVGGGAAVRLVAGQAADPVWSPDGNLIVYAGALVTGQIVPLLGVRPDGRAVELPDVRVRPGGHRFHPRGSGIVYMPSPQSIDFWLLDLVTKKTRPLTQFTKADPTGAFDVTQDGTAIVFDRSRENSDIVLIDLAKK